MSGRWKQAGELDEAAALDGDASFVGVDMRRDPAVLEAGLVSLAVNYQFTQGMAEPRGGFQTMPWAQSWAFDFPMSFPLDFDKSRGFGKVYGVGKFADPFGNAYTLIACRNWAWRITPNAPPLRVKYPFEGSVEGRVTFCQAFNTLLMFRGEGNAPWSLATMEDMVAEPQFIEVAEDEEESGDYTSPIPSAARGIHLGNRVWVPYDGSRLAFSDILSYTRYDASLQEIWVNDGESDRITALVPFGNNALVVLKTGSIYAVQGVTPDPRNGATVQMVTSERGCIAPETVCQIGNDVWFLARDGVFAISQALDNRLQGNAQPVSAPLQPLFARVNWAAADKAAAVRAGNRYYLALPVDGARHNNALAVYDLLTQTWAGWWEMAWLDAAWLAAFTVLGEERLAVVSGDALDATNAGAVYLLTDGYEDERYGVRVTIPATLRTRGLSSGRPEFKTYQAAIADVETWNGAGEIAVYRDGANERGAVQTFSKDRTRWYTFGKGKHNPTNANNDAHLPGREDYSVSPGGAGVKLGASGVAFGMMQTSSERMKLREHAQYLQVQITTTRGRVKVRALRVVVTPDIEGMKTKV